jgi:Family of unknown function (DUF5317)
LCPPTVAAMLLAFLIAVAVVAAAVVVGYALGGCLSALVRLRFTCSGLIGVAVAAHGAYLVVGGRIVIGALPASLLSAVSYSALAIWLALNLRRMASFRLLAVGTIIAGCGAMLNGAVIVANGGMPVSETALERAHPAGARTINLVRDPKHQVLTAGTHLPWLADRMVLRRGVISIGDVLLWLGVVVGIAGAMTSHVGAGGIAATRARAGGP